MTDLPHRDLFGASVDCACGRRHAVLPERVVYAPDAAARLPALLAATGAGRRVVVLVDRRTRAVGGDEAADAFATAGWEASLLLVPDRRGGGGPICDEHTHRETLRAAPAADLVVAAGSGVLSDLGKWLAAERALPYACLATAPSMNGYASANVAPAVDGVKTLVRARPPVLAAADPHVLCQAPAAMITAGLGDLLAKSVSSADWLLNHLVFGDYYCPRAVDLIAAIEPLYLERPEAVARAEPAAIEALFHGLLLTGVSMTMAGTSAPASGGEHMVSHALDMLDSLDHAGHDLHGRQVGVGTLLAAETYRRLLALEAPAWREPEETVDEAFWGALAPVVRRHYAEKLPRLRAARSWLAAPGRWDELRAALAPRLRPPAALRRCLARAGGAVSAADLGCTAERLAAAFAHAHEMRSRVTVLDIARLAGLLPAAQAEILAVAAPH
jgi:glycerol-1-phosphate dehydrogenase [NAD(P)+]